MADPDAHHLRKDWRQYSAAELYERYMVPVIFGPWAAEVVSAIAPQPGERALDLACGTGAVTRLLAEHVGPDGRAVGVDLNAKMLEVARARPTPVVMPIEWHEASALALPFADKSFDVVVCQQGLQFFPDRLGALREADRVLCSHGRLAVSVWSDIDRSPGFKVLADALSRHISPEAGTWMQSPFALHDPHELRRLVREAGFRDVNISTVTRSVRFPSARDFVEQYLAATPLAAFVDRADASARAAFMFDALAALEPFMDAALLSFPMEAHVMTASG